jgi:hypothetical protein
MDLIELTKKLFKLSSDGKVSEMQEILDSLSAEEKAEVKRTFYSEEFQKALVIGNEKTPLEHYDGFKVGDEVEFDCYIDLKPGLTEEDVKAAEDSGEEFSYLDYYIQAPLATKIVEIYRIDYRDGESEPRYWYNLESGHSHTFDMKVLRRKG